jgi:hypothetical protein
MKTTHHKDEQWFSRVKGRYIGDRQKAEGLSKWTLYFTME